MSLTLKEPVKKKQKLFRNSSLYAGKPAFPLLIGGETDKLFSDDVWFISTGRFNGLTVVVDDPEEMKNLHTMGFFGKGCLSKRVPNFGLTPRGPPILRERQWKRRKDWSKTAETLMEESKSEGSKESAQPEIKKPKLVEEDTIVSMKRDDLSSKNQVLVIADSDTEEDFINRLNPRVELENPQTVFESLHLILEEAFFLAYAIGCLQVVDLLGNFLPTQTLWNVFRQTDSNFVENYVAYHYFRAKGWVVKSGLQFGGQFILYKKGPIFYHSSYIVIVDVYSSDEKRVTNDLTSFKLSTLNRLADASFKEVLICEVHRPQVSDGDMNHPDVLSKFTVRENLIRRWIPNQEREASDDL